jgi:hypothetical protein
MAMTTSTASSESRPRSVVNEAVGESYEATREQQTVTSGSQGQGSTKAEVKREQIGRV